MSAGLHDSTDVLLRRDGMAGRITLNRPRSLNLLTGAMVRAMHGALDLWRADPDVHVLIIDAQGRRAFCAGGDIGEVHTHVAAGDFSAARAHVRDEYRLDLKIARYPKPVVALMDGQVMGGGVGLGCHASHPVVTERFRLSLPECAIGWVPDSGSTALLARTPHAVAALMALTGLPIGAADALDLGFIRHVIDGDRRDELIATLCATGAPSALGPLSAPGDEPALRHRAAALARDTAITSPADLDRVLAGVTPEHELHDWCRKLRKALARGAPLAQTLALRALEIQRRHNTVGRALALELRIVSRLMKHPDFSEGIRAMMIDRDKRPTWSVSPGETISRTDTDAFLVASRKSPACADNVIRGASRWSDF
ncbi:enoyl-CoA hydratase/isomerase family protein [Stappia stellulata]|uniref:enoyl-CoA hydratase/isomerase family protein n=1 Tax=Stappia stellulata TaxID=71235 RepID=UPI00041882DA|nr:enoyl-CoA hydratase/isomerase family protein [Stappia stellulata]